MEKISYPQTQVGSQPLKRWTHEMICKALYLLIHFSGTDPSPRAFVFGWIWYSRCVMGLGVCKDEGEKGERVDTFSGDWVDLVLDA